MIIQKEIEKLIEEYIESIPVIEVNKDSLNQIPSNEGLYLFIEKSKKNLNKVVYVGESVNLKKRINANHSSFKYLYDKKKEFYIRIYPIINKAISTKMLELLVLNYLYYELNFYPLLNREI
jgi:excinuclease UvrABC nuclease subunit